MIGCRCAVVPVGGGASARGGSEQSGDVPGEGVGGGGPDLEAASRLYRESAQVIPIEIIIVMVILMIRTLLPSKRQQERFIRRGSPSSFRGKSGGGLEGV